MLQGKKLHKITIVLLNYIYLVKAMPIPFFTLQHTYVVAIYANAF